MLEKFRAAKREEVERLIREGVGGDDAALSTCPAPKESFSLALKKKRDRVGHAVIAEYKRASPSKGDINLTQCRMKLRICMLLQALRLSPC